MPDKISAAIFDWDRTLVESMEGIAIAINYALEQMSEKGYRVNVGYNDEGYAKLTMEETQVRVSSTAEAFFDAQFSQFGDNVATEAFQLWRDKMLEIHLDYIEVLDGTRQTLALLGQLGIPVAIVSNKDEDLLKEEVAFVVGRPEADNIVVKGALPGHRGKPYPDPIFDALQQLNIASSNAVWMIGDSVSDVKAGIKSGSSPVLFSPINCRTTKELRDDPEGQSVIAGREVGFAADHGALQKMIRTARIVPTQPYDPAKNPHFVCKHPAPGQ